MAPIKSNNPIASYFNFFSRSGTDAVTPAPPPSDPTQQASGGTKVTHNSKVYHIFTGTAPFSAPSTFSKNINYIIIGGGGGGGSTGPSGNGGGGGGGSGAVIDKSNVSLTGPFDVTATVGAAGAGNSGPGKGTDGQYSRIDFASGTLTAAGGGASGVSLGSYASSPGIRDGNTGGSGGGAGLYYPGLGGTASGSPFPGTPGTSPDTGWGHAGGRGGAVSDPQNPFYYSGGGGGAGGAGEYGGDGTYASGGTGGVGYSLPSDFQLPAPAMAPNPYGDPGPSGPNHWVAGGGASGMYYDGSGGQPQPAAAARGGGASHGPAGIGYAGAGNGVVSSTGGIAYDNHIDALTNSGSGGGGGGSAATLPGGPGDGGSGGSGLILISYPES